MAKTHVLYLVGLGIIVGALAHNTSACQCDRDANPPCHAYGETPVIFAGLVLESDLIDIETFNASSRKAKMKVENVVKGTIDKEAIIFSDPRCGPFFEPGKEYLVYAWITSDGRLVTSMCSRTRLLAETAADFKYFEQRRFLRDGGVIYGTVKKYAFKYGDDENYGRTKPLSNVSIRFFQEKDGSRFLSRTNSSGRFEISNARAGRYLVHPLLRGGLKLSLQSPTREFKEFELEDRGCEEINFYVNFQDEISGRVLDEKGKGVAGVYVQIVSADSEYKGPKSTAHLLDDAISDERGNYRITRIPPGKYFIGLGIGGDSSLYGKNGRVFYPNESDAFRAKVLTIVERKPLTGLNLKLPK